MSGLTKSMGQRIPGNSLSAVERGNRCAGTGVLLSLILCAFLVDPDKVVLFRCFFREWTGLNCFTCGLSHLLHASACFDWTAAVKHHLFGPLVFMSAWALSVYWILETVLDRKIIMRIKPGNVRFGIVFLAVVWAIHWLFHLTPV